MIFDTEDDYLKYDLSIFYDNNSNIQINEKHLKYNTYLYSIDTMNQNQNQNLEDELKNMASIGVTMIDTLFKTAAPVVKKMSAILKDTNINTATNATTTNTSTTTNTNINNSSITMPYFSNEDDNAFYYVLDIPRANKEACKLDICNNVLTVSAVTEPPPKTFEFLPNNKYEIKFTLPFNVSKDNIVARNNNGALYITIMKKNINNVNIAIID